MQWLKEQIAAAEKSEQSLSMLTNDLSRLAIMGARQGALVVFLVLVLVGNLLLLPVVAMTRALVHVLPSTPNKTLSFGQALNDFMAQLSTLQMRPVKDVKDSSKE